jgi:tripartite-type tricarboxylate transporter receptor subunit TctC
MPIKSLTRWVLSAGALAIALSNVTHAQTYPTKPVKWVVGFPAGGGTDVLARTVAAPLSTQLKQQVIVDNRPGAAGMVAAESVARSPADGYTLLTADIAILAFNPAIYPNIRYDALNDFAPVGLMARFPILIATHPNSGIKSIEQLVADAKKKVSFSYGSAGVGTPHHLAMELMISTTGISAQHVPYRGDAPALQDLAGGQLGVAALAPSLSLPFVRDGKLVPLAVTSDKRLPQLPNVPTLKELGYAPTGVYAWQGMVVPRNTPKSVVATLSQELQGVMAQSSVRQKLADLGMEPIASDAAAMDSHVRNEKRFWEALIKARGIKAD